MKAISMEGPSPALLYSNALSWLDPILLRTNFLLPNDVIDTGCPMLLALVKKFFRNHPPLLNMLTLHKQSTGLAFIIFSNTVKPACLIKCTKGKISCSYKQM